jgi:hypothetical protein
MSTPYKSYTERFEDASFQSYYHTDSLCGSGFHGLATTIERLAKAGQLREARDQIKNCIATRQIEINKRRFPDPYHNRVIGILNDFYHKFVKLQRHYINYIPILNTTLVRYDDTSHTFKVTIGGMELSPDAEDERGGNIKKIIRKNSKSRKNKKSIKNKKTRKGGSRRSLKRSKRRYKH